MKAILTQKIEALFSTSHSAYFYSSPNYEKELPVILVLFDDADKASQSYKLLLDYYENEEVSLFIYLGKEHLEFQLVNKLGRKKINISNLSYDSSQLDQFAKNEPVNRSFVFAAALRNKSLIATNDPYTPLLLRGYKIQQK